MCMLCAAIAYAKPHCMGFNNYDNKVTIVFSDDKACKVYKVSDVKLVLAGKNTRQHLCKPKLLMVRQQ